MVAAYWLISPANAIPAFADQTQQSCNACHVGGFGPALTTFGRQFKENGYTMRAGDAFTVPVSAMAVASYVTTMHDQASPPADHYGTNDNGTLDQISLFLAGGINDHFGGFSQFTYDGVGRAFSWDNIDLRAVDTETLGGKDLLLGLSLNNNPGLTDPLNTMAAWGFPYTDSALAPAPAAGTMISGALAQTVLGATVYAMLDSQFYLEAGLYWTPGHHFLEAMGVATAGLTTVRGAAPYVRLAYMKDLGDQNYSVGVFGFFPSLNPGGDRSTGTSDRYADYGIDASYQYIGSGDNIFTVNAIYTRERQTLNASALLDLAQPRDTLNDFRLDVSYYWHNMIGGTVGFFDTWGSADPLLYADNATEKPNSRGMLFQVDYTPWGDEPIGGRINMRIGAQYRIFNEFDGASKNYDGLGSNASDNNTLRIFSWIAF